MKINHTYFKLSVSLAALLFAQSSFADGTTAGTIVNNTATLSYSVGGAAQSDISSAISNFTVDQKVDLTVSGDSATNIIVNPSTPRATAANKLTYVLKNEGNLAQDFEIAVSHTSGDNFNAGTTPTTNTPQAAEVCQYSIIDNGTGGATTGPHVFGDSPKVNLGIDETANIEVTCSMPNRPDVEDGHVSTIDVLATAVDGSGNIMAETSGPDNEDTMDVVLADDTGTTTDGADRNAKHSDTQTFEINAPMLSVVKTSAVISDPFNLTTNPKRTPGAVVRYTITITNTSDTAATGVTITDELTGLNADKVVFKAGSIVNSAGTTSNYDAGTKTVTASGITVPAKSGGTNGEVEVTFEVTIL